MAFDLNNPLIERFVAAELRRQGAERPSARFLDLGCGDLRYGSYSDNPGWERVFGDYDTRTAKLSLRLDAQHLPFRDESFDVILMTEVLEHLQYPQEALQGIARVLCPNGELILTVPFLWGMHEVPSDYFRFTEFGLARLLRDAGLQLVYFQRRANLIGVVMSYCAILANGVLEGLRRSRWLAPLAWLLSLPLAALGWMFFRLFKAAFGRRGDARYAMPGDGLKGLAGALMAQHLGYNVLARKA